MKETIIFNFASRMRPQKFIEACENIHAMCTSKDYFIWAKVDTNDPTIDQYRAYKGATLVEGYSRSKIHGINRSIITTGWDILVNMSDDVRWTKKGFDDIIKSNMDEDCFLHFPEPWADAQCAKQGKLPISVVSIMDKKYYERFGYVYHPDYISLWCDNEATEVARLLDRHKFVNQAIFSHDHPQAGKAKMDAQYKVTESFYKIDERTYNRRKLKGFPI